MIGSSAINSFGLVDSAMAIIARWRMPPDSSKAYCLKRAGASEMPTRLSISIDRSFAAPLVMSLCSNSCSVIWSPMEIAGAKLAIGSWKIIETAPPRTTCISRAVCSDSTSTTPSSSVNVIRTLGGVQAKGALRWLRSKRPVYRAQANGSASNAIMLTVIAIRFFLRNLASSLARTSGAIGSSSAAGAGSGSGLGTGTGTGLASGT